MRYAFVSIAALPCGCLGFRLEAKIAFNAYDANAFEVVIDRITFDVLDVGPAWPNNFLTMEFKLQG